MSKEDEIDPVINKSSAAYKELKIILTSNKTSYEKEYHEEDLYSLLRSFNTPANLYGIIGVTENLASILPELESIIQQENKVLIKKWLLACEDIELCENIILKNIPSSAVKYKQKNLEGQCSNNPIYSCMWQKHKKIHLRRKYIILQSYVVWAFIRLKLNKVNKKISTKYIWCMNVRKMSEDEFSKVFKKFPDSLLKLEHYEKALVDIISNNTLTAETTTGIKSIISMVKRTKKGIKDKGTQSKKEERKENEKTRRKTTKTKKTRGEMPEPEKLGHYTFNTEDTIENVDVKNDPNIDSKEKRANKRSGLPPADYIGKHDHIKIRSSKPSTGCYTLEEYALLRKDVVRAIAVRNQHLVTQWGDLSLIDFVVASRMLFKIKISKSTLFKNEVCIALLLILWTGREWEQLKKISLRYDIDEPTDPHDIVYLESEKSLLLPVCKDLPSHKLNDIEKTFARDTDKVIKIRLPECISGLIDDFVSTNNKSDTLFTEKITLSHLRKHIKEINLSEYTNITLGNAKGFLKLYISRQPNGARIESAILTDNNAPDDINPMHYSWFSLETISHLYATTVNSLLTEIDEGTLTNIKIVTKIPVQGGTGAGSSITPNKGVIGNMVKALLTRITESRDIDLAHRIVTYHNQYAMYTACMLAYSTGSRATKYPFWLPTDIDINTGLGAISDKDSNDYYNSRLVWLPEICIQQLKYYNEYINALMYRLPIIAPDLYEKVTNQLNNNAVLRNRDAELKSQEDKVPYIFFMHDNTNRKNNSWIDSDAKELYRRIKVQLPLPLNVNRHYLRTRLREEGCPEEIVNAFMGHWLAGQEPFGKYSSLSPITYTKTLKKYLPKILALDGWESIQGDILS